MGSNPILDRLFFSFPNNDIKFRTCKYHLTATTHATKCIISPQIYLSTNEQRGPQTHSLTQTISQKRRDRRLHHQATVRKSNTNSNQLITHVNSIAVWQSEQKQQRDHCCLITFDITMVDRISRILQTVVTTKY